MSGTTPFTDTEREVWLRMMTETYEQFVNKAAEGRKMERHAIDPLAQGRIWTGRAAVENGLVDALGTLDDAIIEAKQLAGLRADDDVDLMVLPKPVSMFEQMFGLADVEVRLKAHLPEMLNRLGEVEPLRRLFQEPSVLLLPYRLEIK
jgi:protease-4